MTSNHTKNLLKNKNTITVQEDSITGLMDLLNNASRQVNVAQDELSNSPITDDSQNIIENMSSTLDGISNTLQITQEHIDKNILPQHTGMRW